MPIKDSTIEMDSEIKSTGHRSVASESPIADGAHSKDFDAKSPWRVFIESSGGAALITIVLGGFFGHWITSSYQDRQLRERARLQTAREAIEQLSSSVSASDDLLQLSTEAMFNAPTTQRDAIRKRFNEADDEWRRHHLSTGLLLVYQNRVPGFSQVWTDTDRAVTAYEVCAANWIVSNAWYRNGLPNGCVPEKRDVDQSLQKFMHALESR